MFAGPKPRTANSALKSSPVATPGSTCTARNGSSATRPRSASSSRLFSTDWLDDARLRFTKRARADRDVLDVGARAFSHRNRDVDGIRPADRHIAAHESVADDGDEQRLRSDRNVVDLELAVRVRERLLAGGLDFHEDSGERRAGARFDDGAGDLSRLTEECRAECGEEENQHMLVDRDSGQYASRS